MRTAKRALGVTMGDNPSYILVNFSVKHVIMVKNLIVDRPGVKNSLTVASFMVIAPITFLSMILRIKSLSPQFAFPPRNRNTRTEITTAASIREDVQLGVAGADGQVAGADY